MVAILGAVLVIDALVNQFRLVPFVVGLVMVGLLPVDAIVDAITSPVRDNGDVDRLREVMRNHEEDNP